MLRRAFGVATVVAVGVVGGAGQAGGQAPEGLIPEGDWTDAQVQELLDLIEETEDVLPERFPVVATYEELEAALTPLGFFEFGVSAPGGYDHWINRPWLFDEHLVEPEFAESLVYRHRDDGRWELVSAMFMLSPEHGMSDIPDEIAHYPGWHVHPELCTRPDGTFAGVTDPDDPSCPPGSSQALGSPMMHVWIVDNECNHRFGGVGVSGLHCDHDGHDGHDDDGHDDDGHDDDGHHATTTTTAASPPTTAGDDPGDDRGSPPMARPAQPVAGWPTYTG